MCCACTDVSECFLCAACNCSCVLDAHVLWARPARDSAALRPAASPDGRAYFYSALGDDDLERVATRQRVTTFPGDALWVPPWTWHRVDYGRDGGPSVAACELWLHWLQR